MSFRSRIGIMAIGALLLCGSMAMAGGFDIVQQYDAVMITARTADLDNDNYVDLVWTTPVGAPSTVNLGSWVAYGQPNGLFSYAKRLNFEMNAPMLIDFVDEDDYADIVVVTSEITNHEMIIYHNNGNRTFTPVTTIPVYSSVFPTLATGFFNNDVHLDVMLGDGSLYFGDGTGSFSHFTGTGLPDQLEAIDVADFNRDGKDDIVAYHNSASAIDTIATYINNGYGVFTKAGFAALYGGANEVTTNGGRADFNNDGNVDFSIAFAIGGYPYSSLVIVGFTDGTGGIELDTVSVSEGYFKDVIAADVNRDRRLDIVTSNASNIPVARMVVYYGDGHGGFYDSLEVPYGGEPGINLTLASGDFDRDGNPDFVSAGSFQTATPITILYDDELGKVIKPPKMTVTSLSEGDIRVVNPDQFVISREFRTVAGSEYLRRDFNNDDVLDKRTIDYNLQDGDYCICVVPNAGMQAGDKVTVQTEIDGDQAATLFLDYEVTQQQTFDGGDAGDTLKFIYNVNTASAISPRNGIPTGDTQPIFNWGKVVQSDNPPVSYDFQLAEDLSFGTPLIDETGLATARYVPSTDLTPDKVYYWRYRIFDGATYSDYSPTFAAYVTPDCCIGVRGNVNGDPDQLTNMSDITYLVAYLFGSPAGPPPPCMQEANINGDPDKDVNISDMTYVIEYMFGIPTGPVPPSCD